MQKYLWDRLNKRQLGTYAKYCLKAEFAMYGFVINETEIDEHGTYFVARYNETPLFEVQVRSVRQTTSYTFMLKSKFVLEERRYLALALLFESQPPSLYLIPSIRWQTPDFVFVDRNYEGLQSAPEWGISISPRNLQALEPYLFESTVERLMNT
ncbi:MAG: DUF4365 domain-containing protein [Chloroflexota bacterium]